MSKKQLRRRAYLLYRLPKGLHEAILQTCCTGYENRVSDA